MARNVRRQLARRLRELREFELGAKLTQEALAAALSERKHLSGAAVSTWENGGSDKWPSDDRLTQYALLFSSPEHLQPKPRVPDKSELDRSARERFVQLRRDLQQLREDAEREARRERTAAPAGMYRSEMWQHDRAADIMIVTSELPDESKPDIARSNSVNYTRLARYGNLDAFFEMYVKISAMGYQNRHHRAANDRGIDLEATLVLVGGPSRNRVTRNFLDLLDLPLTQVGESFGTGDYFVMSDGEQVRPRMTDFPDGEQELVEDVGMFVRARNPANPDTDLTICTGAFTAGTLAAVRAFTNEDVADANVEVVRSKVGRITDFYALFRVPVVYGRVPAPRLSVSLLEARGI